MLMRTNITIFFEYYFLFKVYLYKNDIFLTQTLSMEQQNFTFVNYNTCFKTRNGSIFGKKTGNHEWFNATDKPATAYLQSRK